MKIKIHSDNAIAIASALKAVNGSAEAFTVTSPSAVRYIAQ